MNKKLDVLGILKNIGFFVGFILLGILILFILINAFIPKLSMTVFNVKPVIVEHISMEPTLNRFDLIFVTDKDFEEIKEGDMVSYYVKNNPDLDVATHYFYELDYDGADNPFLRVRREGSPAPITQIIFEEDYIGTYVFKIPKAGYVINFLASPFGIAAVVVNIGIIVTVVLVIKSSKKNHKETDQA
ncbi:MAG: signal peptidase I [Bacillota bacterium]|nr:MAG: signal peptidase I [Bacillota bacterium]